MRTIEEIWRKQLTILKIWMGITSRNLTTVLFFFFNALSPGQTDSQVDASQRKFTTCVRLAFRLATHLRGLASRVAPFASPYASSGFANLCWLALTCESVWPELYMYWRGFLILKEWSSSYFSREGYIVWQISWFGDSKCFIAFCLLTIKFISLPLLFLTILLETQ